MSVAICMVWVRGGTDDNELFPDLPSGWPVPRVGETIGVGTRPFKVDQVIHCLDDPDGPHITICVEPLSGSE